MREAIMSEVPRSYKELLLYALKCAVDARGDIERLDIPQRKFRNLSRYYSAIEALIVVASPYLSNTEELLEKATEAWRSFNPESEAVGPTARALDGVLREIVSQLVSAGAI